MLSHPSPDSDDNGRLVCDHRMDGGSDQPEAPVRDVYRRGPARAAPSGMFQQRALFHLHLLLQKKRAGLVVVADLVELDLVRDRGGEPGAADNSQLATAQ